MRSTRSKELFAAKKEAENQRKALSDKILTLERQVKDARYREEEERRNFDEKLKFIDARLAGRMDAIGIDRYEC